MIGLSHRGSKRKKAIIPLLYASLTTAFVLCVYINLLEPEAPLLFQSMHEILLDKSKRKIMDKAKENSNLRNLYRSKQSTDVTTNHDFLRALAEEKARLLRRDLKEREREMNYYKAQPRKLKMIDDLRIEKLLDEFLPRHSKKLEPRKTDEEIESELDLEMKRILSKYSMIIPKKCRGKERLLKFFLKSNQEIPNGICSKLPSWEVVRDLYGTGPVFVKDCGRIIGTGEVLLSPKISALPNSGVGLLKRMINANFPDINLSIHGGSRQTAAVARAEAALRKDMGIVVPPMDDTYLRVILVKDPFFWMESICLGPPEYFDYAPLTAKRVHWDDDQYKYQQRKSDKCPYILTPVSGGDAPFPVYQVSHGYAGQQKSERFDSLVDYWNKWVGGFILEDEPNDVEATAPYIVIRYEDLLFHPKEVIDEIGQCSGYQPEKKLMVETTLSAKEARRFANKPTSGLLDRAIEIALTTYSNDERRIHGMSQRDLRYIERELHPKLLNMLQYSLP